MKTITTLPEAQRHFEQSHEPVLLRLPVTDGTLQCASLLAVRRALGVKAPALKPCPFCNGAPEYAPLSQGHAPGHYWPEHVRCLACHIMFRTGEASVADAVLHWNTRHGGLLAQSDV